MAGIELKYTNIYHFIHPCYIHSKSCRGGCQRFGGSSHCIFIATVKIAAALRVQCDSTSQFDRPSNMVISRVRFVILMRHNEGLFTAPSNSLIFIHFCQFPQMFHFLSLLFKKSETSCFYHAFVLTTLANEPFYNMRISFFQIFLQLFYQVTESTEISRARHCLFSRHPAMASWPKKHRWFFAKLNIKQIQLLDFYGGISNVPLQEYYSAKLYPN